MVSVPFEMEQVEVGMLFPVIPLLEKSQLPGLKFFASLLAKLKPWAKF